MNPGVGLGELGVVMWFVLCGCIHMFFEGMFVCFKGQDEGDRGVQLCQKNGHKGLDS